MGAKFSLSLANLYMEHWEVVYLFSHVNPFTSHIRWYGRYIDDLFLLWENMGSRVKKFVDFINQNPLNLKFTYSSDPTTIQFLDLTLIGDTSKCVTISPHRKSTAKNSTLLTTSCHPAHIIHNIPLGELVCTKRNCTTPEVHQKAEQEARTRLRSRRHPEWTLIRAKH